MKASVSYHVDILGTIWMPSLAAASVMTITTKDLDCAGEPHDVDLACIQRYVDTHAGDFSSIDALRVVKVEVAKHAPTQIRDGWTSHVTHTRETVLSDFTDDEESAFFDCMYGGGEDDE